MQLAVGRLAPLASLVVLIVAGGCSALPSRDQDLTSFERTRRRANQDGSAFSPGNVNASLRYLTGNGPNPDEARQAFWKAQQLYQDAIALRDQNQLAESQAKFVDAAVEFADAAERWPDSAMEQDALYMTGESYFFADHYWDAETAYEELLERYQHSRHLDAVQPRRFAIAQYWLELNREDPMAFYEWNVFDESKPSRGMFGHAMRVFDRIRLDDPTGTLADDATLALGNAYFAKKKFLKADEYYTDLRKTFPSSDHQFQAHFLGLKSKLEAYQGPDYSANALDEAEKLLDQIRKQFPADAEREAEFLAREAARVKYLLAERDWLLAKRFDQRAEYGAARHYYTALLTNYRETPFGESAEQRLREIGGLPNVPDQPLPWLVAVFPVDEDVKPILTSNPATARR